VIRLNNSNSKIEQHVKKYYMNERRKRMIVLILGAILTIIGAGMVIWSIVYTSKKYDSMILKESMYESEIVEIPSEEFPDDISEQPVEQKECSEELDIYPLKSETIEKTTYEYVETEEEDVFKELYEDIPDFDGYLDIPLSHELQVELFADCDIYGVDYALALALMDTESSFRSDIGNEEVLGGKDGGARYYGYMQLSIENCLRAEEYGLDAHTPEGNIEMGIKILGNLLLDYDEEWEAITAYKGGAGYLQSCKSKGIIPETTKNVLSKKAKYEAMIKGE